MGDVLARGAGGEAVSDHAGGDEGGGAIPRIRTLKPEHKQHRKVGILTDRQYRLWVGMITEADDEGRLCADARWLRAVVFGFHPDVTDELVADELVAIEQTGLIRLYRVRDTVYAWFPSWKEHQRIDHPTRSVLPTPPMTVTGKKQAIPAQVRRDVARQYGAIPGEEKWVDCHWCRRAQGLIHWYTAEGWVYFQDLELDHVIPEFHGGETVAENLVLACRTCNRSRGTKSGKVRDGARLRSMNPRERSRLPREQSRGIGSEGSGSEGSGSEGITTGASAPSADHGTPPDSGSTDPRTANGIPVPPKIAERVPELLRWPAPEALAALWNWHAREAGLSQVETRDGCVWLSDKRQEKARRMIRQRPDWRWWNGTFGKIAGSKFLIGQVPPANGHSKPFRCDFDWVLACAKDGTENAVKLHDGRYDR